MYPIISTRFVPQGIPLFLQYFMPLRPVFVPATLHLLPDADPEDDPDDGKDQS